MSDQPNVIMNEIFFQNFSDMVSCKIKPIGEGQGTEDRFWANICYRNAVFFSALNIGVASKAGWKMAYLNGCSHSFLYLDTPDMLTIANSNKDEVDATAEDFTVDGKVYGLLMSLVALRLLWHCYTDRDKHILANNSNSQYVLIIMAFQELASQFLHGNKRSLISDAEYAEIERMQAVVKEYTKECQ